jgi:hypothetical protein
VIVNGDLVLARSRVKRQPMLRSNSFRLELVGLLGLPFGNGCLFANWRNEDVKMGNVEANGISSARFHRRQYNGTSKTLAAFAGAAE